MKKKLIKEQNHLCCYCCNQIEIHNSHIEHFKPQSMYPNETLDYTNMFASCNGIDSSKENCGHKKGAWYNEYYSISPLWADCESYFHYKIDGRIIPNPINTRAVDTIDKLELDSSLLQRARKGAINASGIFDSDFDDESEEEVSELLELYTIPQNDKLPPFSQAITYCINNL